MKLTNQQINFLEHNGWSTCYINGILEISNSETGCRLSSPLSNDFAEQFAIEKIEELLEDLENDEIKLDISEE